MVDFKAKIKDVPNDPGVYMMLDENGEIIYVGKAKNLKNRLRSYFFNLSNRTAKVMAMLQHVADFRYIICASEVDALLTENNLIKKHTPRYNILLKDDKAYPFLRIDMKEPYPTIKLVRKLQNDGAKYFGPYMQSVNIRDIFDLIHTAFPVRDCNRDLSKPSRPCLNAHLGRCIAPCSGKVSEEEYKAEMQKVIDFLKGNDREVERVLTDKMKKFAEEENFEVALNYRNKLQLLDKLVRKQVSSLPKRLQSRYIRIRDERHSVGNQYARSSRRKTRGWRKHRCGKRGRRHCELSFAVLSKQRSALRRNRHRLR
ncbi:MAG: GIY-YIG nuclease family protein [Christensenella sp.]|nr:MAG: GIY-YIG nuclease family protein [Christensenella sp.]